MNLIIIFAIMAILVTGLASPAFATEISIDNDIPSGTLGHFEIEMQTAGESRDATITAEGFDSGVLETEEVIFDYFTYIDTGNGGFRLSETTTSGPTLAGDDVVISAGSFTGSNDNTIQWSTISGIVDGERRLVTGYQFIPDIGELGNIRLYQYLDEDVDGSGDDIFFTRGTVAAGTFELFTLDDSQVFGVSHSGGFSAAQGLINSAYVGFAADEFDDIRDEIEDGTQAVSISGVIDTGDLPLFDHPVVGPARGPTDIVSVMAWDVDPNAHTSVIVTTLGGVATLEDIEPEQPKKTGGGDNQWDTRPSFGISHETRQDQIVENGFSFNTEYFTVTDNHWTDFPEQSIEIGMVNTFSATVWADKGLKVQEFLFGIPNVGESHLAEFGVEVWYDSGGEIEDVIVVQNSHVIDADTISVSHEMTKCLPTDAEARCDTTTVSMTFLEPLLDKVMAIKAIDWKNRDQRTYLNDGFDISGESLNPMLSKMIPSVVRYEGLLKVTQVAKYSPYWVADNDRMFEMNSFGSFKQINYKFERFQDTGTAYTRMHSGFGGIIAYEQDRALDVFDAGTLASELPASFAYIFPETGERITEELREAMLVQEEIAKSILDEMDRQDRHY